MWECDGLFMRRLFNTEGRRREKTRAGLHETLTRLAPYGVAVLSVALAAAIRLELDSILGRNVPFAMFMFAVILTSWYGGLWPGLLATVLSLLAGDYLFIAPRYSVFTYDYRYDSFLTILYGLFGLVVSLFNNRLRKSVEAEKENSARFRLLVEGVKDYEIVMLDTRGRVASWNSGAERIKGYTADEIIGRDFSVFYTPEDIERGEPQRELEIAAAEGRYKESGWQARKDGSRYWASGVIAAVHDDKGRLRGFTKITRDTTERKLAEEALRDSQEFAQHIIEVSPSVIYIYDLERQEEVFINCDIPATLGWDTPRKGETLDFLRSTMHPDDWRLFLDHLNRLAGLSNDETIEFEYRIKRRNGEWGWFHSREKVFARNEDGGVREIIGTATDITERRQAMESAHFFSDLDMALRPLADAEEIKSAAARMLGEYLGADRCAYAEVEADEEYLEITCDYTRGETPSVVGRFCVDDLGAEALRMMRADRPYVVDDIEADVSARRDLSAYRRAEVRALMCVPLVKNGRYVARMAVSQKTPRRWAPREVELATKVASRCWESVERARAVRNLRESDDRYRAFIANSSEAIWRYELEQPIPVTLPEDEQIEMLYKYAYLAECNDVMARMYGYESADQVVGARIGDLLRRSDPHNIAYLRAFKRSGYHLTDVETHEVDRRGNTKYFLNNQIGIVENGAVVRCWGIQSDITNLKQAEQALRESEERLRRITDATQDALWEVDLTTNHLWWSEGARPLFGHGPGDLAPGLEDWYNSIHPEDADRVKARFEDFMGNGDLNWVDEYRFRRADGSYVYILDQGRKFFDENGKPSLIAGAMSDITARKEGESALREGEERYRLLTELSPDGVVIACSDGTIHLANQSMLRMLNAAPELVIGRSLFDFLSPRCRAQYRACVTPMMTGHLPEVQVEIAFRRVDGQIFPAEVSAARFDWQGRSFAQLVIRDITERKRAEDALRRSEERARRQLAYLEAIYATAPVGLCFVDADLRFLSINERLAKMGGKSVEEHLGRTLREIVPELADTLEPYYRRVIETGEPFLNAELSDTSETGAVRHFISSYYPIKNGDGRVLGVNAVVQEITQRKKTEEERERLLKQEKAAREEAESANRMKDEFLATISHELRTPLTSILGWARMLTGGALDTTQARHALEVIAQSAQSQTQLIEDILDTSRIINGRLKLEAAPLNIGYVFNAAVDVIRPSAEAKGLSLNVVGDVQDGVVFGDANRLQQAIWNLLSNAVKFTNEGGSIQARLERAEGQIEITISDTGIGVDPQFLPYVFDRFRQADSASTREYGGLGLGLAIVRHIVEMHGGGVSASSPGKDQGATFKVRLPLITTLRMAAPENLQAPAIKERKTLEDGHRLDGVRVLLVEDNPDTLDMLKFILDEAGAEVVATASVDEALEAYDRQHPDALVSDIAMPDRDGYDLIQEIRQREPEGRKIPAVAVTAYTRVEDRVRALAAGFQMHVAKPVDPDELVAVVASLTGHIHY